MSALGQKQTYAAHKLMSALPQLRPRKPTSANGMSALPPKADMCGATAHVCFGPIADMTLSTREMRTTSGEAPSRFEVDDQLVLRRQLDWQIAHFSKNGRVTPAVSSSQLKRCRTNTSLEYLIGCAPKR